MRLELTRVGLLVELANHYTTRGASALNNVQWLVYPKTQPNHAYFIYMYKEDLAWNTRELLKALISFDFEMAGII